MLQQHKIEALVVADKLVVMTRGRQTGTENNQLRQLQACCGMLMLTQFCHHQVAKSTYEF
jgi:hypothetical protein